MTTGDPGGIRSKVDTSTSGSTKYANPWGFGEALGTQPIPNSGAFFGIRDPATGFGAIRVPTGISSTRSLRPSTPTTLTVDQIMSAFVHSGDPNDPMHSQLAGIQSQMYRAGGYYSANFVPQYGHIRQEDIAAFRQFLIGFAVNPNPNGIGTELTSQALYGDTQGVNTRKRAPLVITVSNPDDIRAVVHKAALDLYGGDLNEEQTQAFISTFQAQQAQEQTLRYQAGDYTLTGDTQGPGGTVTSAPGAAGLQLEAEQAIRQAHPEQVFVSGLGKTLGAMLPGLLGPGAGMLGG